MTIKIELVGNKIHMDAPYALRNECKNVRGYFWLKQKKRWTYPLDFNTCKEIREMADRVRHELVIGPELWKWAAQEKKRLEKVPHVSSMELAELPRLEKENPFLWQALQNRPFQTVGAAFAAAHRQTVLADDPGLGKTPQSIAHIIEANVMGPVLVVAPKVAAELTWPVQMAQWAPGEAVFCLAGKTPAKRAEELKNFIAATERQTFGHFSKRQWLIINPYWVRAKAELDDKGNYKHDKKDRDKGIGISYTCPELFDIEWQAIIVDESHDVLIIPSMNRKKWTQDRIGMENLPQHSYEGLRMAMSGTPMRGKKEQFFGTLQWLKPKHYTSYWRWAERYFSISKEGYSMEVGALINPEAFYKDLSEVMIRRTKEEAAPDLPPKIYGGTRLDPNDPNSPVSIWLKMTPKQAKQYKEMEADGTATGDDGNQLMADGLLSEWTRRKQIASAYCKVVTKQRPMKDEFDQVILDDEGNKVMEDYNTLVPQGDSNKLNWIINFLEERGISAKPEGDGKVIIASQFAETCTFIEQELAKLKIPSYKLIGSTSSAKRVDMMRGFMEDSGPDCIRVFILSTKAGGVSLTLDVADDVIIHDETYIPDEQLQVEDRAHRVSRPDHQVSIWYLRSLDTIEEGIAATTHSRQMDMDLILDKSRGHEVRRLIKEYVPMSQRKESS